MLVLGCKKKDPTPSQQDCVASAEKVSDAALAYGSKFDKESCENYKSSVRDYVNTCSSIFTAVDKKVWDDVLAQPCPN